MASNAIQLQVRPRGKPIKSLPETITISANATATDLYSLLAKQSRFSVHQLRVTKGSDGGAVANDTQTSVQGAGLQDQSIIFVKDLGPQIAWRTVFVVEYFGPILVHLLVYAIRPYVYRDAPAQSSPAQTLVLWMVVLHFVKREVETLFVHRFSAATMPFRNIFKNSAHYWLLSGLNMAVWIYAPFAPTAKNSNPLLIYTGLALWLVGEVANASVHLTLRGLRSAGGTERNIPQGTLFNIVTCPNYLMETISWLGVYLVSGFSWSVLLFIAVSVGQMMEWSKKKEKRYRKEFGDKYKKKRFTMLPGIW